MATTFEPDERKRPSTTVRPGSENHRRRAPPTRACGVQTATSLERHPTVLLDLDGVLCENDTYGGRHVYESFRHPAHRPSDLYSRLFSAQAVVVLNELLDEFAARFVLTTSWLSLLDRPQFVHVFEQCGLPRVAESFHRHWAAPTNRGESRLDAILRWLRAHHEGEPFVVLDDVESGGSLTGSTLEAAGRVILCGATGCLQPPHLQFAQRALGLPVYEPHPVVPSGG